MKEILEISLGKLKTATSNQLDWTALLNTIMSKASSSPSFTDDTEVFVENLSTLKALLEVVSKTPPRVVVKFLRVNFGENFRSEHSASMEDKNDYLRYGLIDIAFL